jgi:hypothetical protein
MSTVLGLMSKMPLKISNTRNIARKRRMLKQKRQALAAPDPGELASHEKNISVKSDRTLPGKFSAKDVRISIPSLTSVRSKINGKLPHKVGLRLSFWGDVTTVDAAASEID